MDVSIQTKKPGHPRATTGPCRLTGLSYRTRLSTRSLGTLILLLFSLGACSAHGFTITNLGWGASVQLRPNDIAQDGAGLGSAAEQALGQGNLRTDLSDFSLPVDVNLAGALGSGTLTTRVARTFAFMVRLSNAERNRCVGNEDFDIRLSITGPIRNAFRAIGPDGGTLRLLRFEPDYRGAWGSRCPATLFYGYTMELSVADAVSSGTYEATAAFEVNLPGPGGSTEVIQVPLQIQMPGLLLLYHHNRISINLTATALAGALGADRACNGGFCMDLGARVIPVSNLSAPIAADITADAGAVVPVQTITLRNAVAVRATGCSNGTYDSATYQIRNAAGGIRNSSGTIGGIQSAACGMDLRMGDLSFDLDLSRTDATAGNASATFQITVTGL